MPNDNLLGEITTEEEALPAVRRDGLALEHVPKALRDEVRAALKSGDTKVRTKPVYY